jgi:molecular chaperone GrpE
MSKKHTDKIIDQIDDTDQVAESKKDTDQTDKIDQAADEMANELPEEFATGQATGQATNQETNQATGQATNQETNQATGQATNQEDLASQLQEQLRLAREAERRALADYQNLVRRNQEERAAFVKFAAKDLVTSLLEPLTHLDMAAKQINDPGLNMVVEQFWSCLQDVGLEKVDVMGEKFDVSIMEAADTSGDGEKVVAVHRPAFKFHGEVIQHARVVVGDKQNTKVEKTKKV